MLEYEFKNDLNAYLATRPDLPVHTLADLIAFDEAHAAEEMPYFLQQLFIDSQAKGPLTDAVYLNALATDFRVSRQEGIDELMNRLNLNALLAPTRNPAWTVDLINGDRSMGGSSTPCALAGYPSHHRHRRQRLRPPARGGQLHGTPLERAYADQDCLCFRAGHQGPQGSAVPAHAGTALRHRRS